MEKIQMSDGQDQGHNKSVPVARVVAAVPERLFASALATQMYRLYLCTWSGPIILNAYRYRG